jgi:hypothetical protein
MVCAQLVHHHHLLAFFLVVLFGLLQASSSLLHVHKLTHVANGNDYTIVFKACCSLAWSSS